MRMTKRDYARVEVSSRAQLRAWLDANHRDSAAIWLVTFKKAAGERYVAYNDIVEEVLCFGWIDSLPRKLDDTRTMVFLSPRRPGSSWPAANRERVTRLIATGQMTPTGQRLIDAAKADGSWNALENAETGEAPPDLRAALEAVGATEAFQGFTLATRKRCIEYLDAAKRPDTRTARIAKIVAGAAAGTDPLAWRPRV